MSHTIVIYTDGSALGNPGPAGFAYLLINKKSNTVIEYGEHRDYATNNQMELWALLSAFKKLCSIEEKQHVIIHLDSEYVKNGISVWVKNWKKNGWKTAAKKPVLNKELWEKIDELYDQVKTMHDIDLKYVPGHAGFAGNEIVDTIARTLAGCGSWKFYNGDKEEYEKTRAIKV